MRTARRSGTICAPCTNAPRGSQTLSRTLALAILLGLARPTLADSLSVGFGLAPLPTPEGGTLSGYGGLRDRRAERTLDVPEARALVLEQGALRVALVTLDVLIARPVLRDPLVEAAALLGVDSVILLATHTHSGPGGYLEGWVAGRMTGASYDPAVPERLRGALTRALERGVGDLRPARVGSALDRVDLAENRAEEDGPAESALPVLRIEGDGGVRRALFSYGAHPIVLSPRVRAYSGDYPGAARKWLADRGWEATFAPGPLGDQRPVSRQGPLWPKSVEAQESQAREIGEHLGEKVLATLEGIETRAGAGLVAVERWVEPPASKLRRGCLVWWLAPISRGPLGAFLSPRVPFHALRVGDAVLLAVPAEPTTRVGERLRATMPAGSVRFVLAHANDWLGYVVERDRYHRGGYEACLSLQGEGLADWLVAEAAETVRLLESRALASGARGHGEDLP